MSYVERREKYRKIIEFVDDKKGREYYRNADGKLVSQFVDDTVDYRADELADEVKSTLDRAREMHNYRRAQ